MKFNTILNQILQFLPQTEFDKAIKSLKTDRYVKYFKTKRLFGLHLYAQIRQKDSLRDIKIMNSSSKTCYMHLMQV
ncbi:MAG: DUF4372 domain-containing protein [bacterium]|nr:DUF4372 domain-containing protein [bacterium]